MGSLRTLNTPLGSKLDDIESEEMNTISQPPSASTNAAPLATSLGPLTNYEEMIREGESAQLEIALAGSQNYTDFGNFKLVDMRIGTYYNDINHDTTITIALIDNKSDGLADLLQRTLYDIKLTIDSGRIFYLTNCVFRDLYRGYSRLDESRFNRLAVLAKDWAYEGMLAKKEDPPKSRLLPLKKTFWPVVSIVSICSLLGYITVGWGGVLGVVGLATVIYVIEVIKLLFRKER